MSTCLCKLNEPRHEPREQLFLHARDLHRSRVGMLCYLTRKTRYVLSAREGSLLSFARSYSLLLAPVRSCGWRISSWKSFPKCCTFRFGKISVWWQTRESKGRKILIVEIVARRLPIVVDFQVLPLHSHFPLGLSSDSYLVRRKSKEDRDWAINQRFMRSPDTDRPVKWKKRKGRRRPSFRCNRVADTIADSCNSSWSTIIRGKLHRLRSKVHTHGASFRGHESAMRQM